MSVTSPTIQRRYSAISSLLSGLLLVCTLGCRSTMPVQIEGEPGLKIVQGPCDRGGTADTCFAAVEETTRRKSPAQTGALLLRGFLTGHVPADLVAVALWLNPHPRLSEQEALLLQPYRALLIPPHPAPGEQAYLYLGIPPEDLKSRRDNMNLVHIPWTFENPGAPRVLPWLRLAAQGSGVEAILWSNTGGEVRAVPQAGLLASLMGGGLPPGPGVEWADNLLEADALARGGKPGEAKELLHIAGKHDCDAISAEVFLRWRLTRLQGDPQADNSLEAMPGHCVNLPGYSQLGLLQFLYRTAGAPPQPGETVTLASAAAVPWTSEPLLRAMASAWRGQIQPSINRCQPSNTGGNLDVANDRTFLSTHGRWDLFAVSDLVQAVQRIGGEKQVRTFVERLLEPAHAWHREETRVQALLRVSALNEAFHTDALRGLCSSPPGAPQRESAWALAFALQTASICGAPKNAHLAEMLGDPTQGPLEAHGPLLPTARTVGWLMTFPDEGRAGLAVLLHWMEEQTPVGGAGADEEMQHRVRLALVDVAYRGLDGSEETTRRWVELAHRATALEKSMTLNDDAPSAWVSAVHLGALFAAAINDTVGGRSPDGALYNDDLQDAIHMDIDNWMAALDAEDLRVPLRRAVRACREGLHFLSTAPGPSHLLHVRDLIESVHVESSVSRIWASSFELLRAMGWSLVAIGDLQNGDTEAASTALTNASNFLSRALPEGSEGHKQEVSMAHRLLLGGVFSQDPLPTILQASVAHMTAADPGIWWRANGPVEGLQTLVDAARGPERLNLEHTAGDKEQPLGRFLQSLRRYPTLERAILHHFSKGESMDESLWAQHPNGPLLAGLLARWGARTGITTEVGYANALLSGLAKSHNDPRCAPTDTSIAILPHAAFHFGQNGSFLKAGATLARYQQALESGFPGGTGLSCTLGWRVGSLRFHLQMERNLGQPYAHTPPAIRLRMGHNEGKSGSRLQCMATPQTIQGNTLKTALVKTLYLLLGEEDATAHLALVDTWEELLRALHARVPLVSEEQGAQAAANLATLDLPLLTWVAVLGRFRGHLLVSQELDNLAASLASRKERSLGEFLDEGATSPGPLSQIAGLPRLFPIVYAWSDIQNLTSLPTLISAAKAVSYRSDAIPTWGAEVASSVLFAAMAPSGAILPNPARPKRALGRRIVQFWRRLAEGTTQKGLSEGNFRRTLSDLHGEGLYGEMTLFAVRMALVAAEVGKPEKARNILEAAILRLPEDAPLILRVQIANAYLQGDLLDGQLDTFLAQSRYIDEVGPFLLPPQTYAENLLKRINLLGEQQRFDELDDAIRPLEALLLRENGSSDPMAYRLTASRLALQAQMGNVDLKKLKEAWDNPVQHHPAVGDAQKLIDSLLGLPLHGPEQKLVARKFLRATFVERKSP